MTLVNAFDKLNLESTQSNVHLSIDTTIYFKLCDIEKQLRNLNTQLSLITGIEVEEEDEK